MKIISLVILLSFTIIACNDTNKDANSTNRSLVTNAVLPKDTSAPVLSDTLIEFDESVSTQKRKEIMKSISKKYLMGQFDPTQDERFSLIPTPYATKEMYMRGKALESFKKMYAAAKTAGITFQIVSATRPFDAQKSIWEAKWTGKRKVDGKLLSKEVKDPKARALQILRWSSMPSTSRHHWGTDIDLNNLNPDYWTKGQGLKEYNWLIAHAHEYGFCQVYSEMGADRPFGYQEEKWHWSYLPISQLLTAAYAQKIIDSDIKGFEGAESAPMIEVVKKYVLGINPACF